jgi:hypothetical protein
MKVLSDIPTLYEADVVVVGAGSAGCGAAIAAAEEGRSVVLVERYGFAGGTSTQILDTFYGFFTPGEESLLYELKDGKRRFAAPRSCVRDSHKSPQAESMAKWMRTVLKIRTSNEEFQSLYRQSLDDMAALRLPTEGTDHMVLLPAAGLPWFIAPFGRDSLIVSLQNSLIYPGFARGTLDVLGSLHPKMVERRNLRAKCTSGEDNT